MEDAAGSNAKSKKNEGGREFETEVEEECGIELHGGSEGAICYVGLWWERVWRNEMLYANQCRGMFYGMADSDKKCKGPRGFGHHYRTGCNGNFYYIL